MDFIENFDLNINKSVIDSIQLGNKQFRNLVKTNSKAALKSMKNTRTEINNTLKDSEKKIKANIREAELEINTALGQIQDPSTLIDTTIRTGQRGFRANVMNPMNTYKGKFLNTLSSGYREKIIKPLAIIDRGARRGIVNSDVATRTLLRQIKPGNDVALKKYLLRPLSQAHNEATRAVQKAYINSVILPVNYADQAIKRTINNTNSQIKTGLQQMKPISTSDVDIYIRSQLSPINQSINQTESSILSSTYRALNTYNTIYDDGYANLHNILIKPFMPNSAYKGESFIYMICWSFFLLLALISQGIYDATIGNILNVIGFLTGLDLSGKSIKKSKVEGVDEEPVSIVGAFSDAANNIWTKNTIVKKVKNIFYKFFLIIASIFDLITLAFINNATFFTDLVVAMFGAAPAPPSGA
jgi:hypothetical protein